MLVPARFDHGMASSVGEAIELLQRHGQEAHIGPCWGRGSDELWGSLNSPEDYKRTLSRRQSTDAS